MKKYCTFMLLILLAVVFQTAAAETLTIPSGTVTIEGFAFYSDTSLDEVVLPEGIKYIGEKAFASSSVTKVNLPDSLEFIADDAFDEISPEPEFTFNTGTYAEEWVNNHNTPAIEEITLTLGAQQTMYAFDGTTYSDIQQRPWINRCEIDEDDWKVLKKMYPGKRPVWNVVSGDVWLDDKDPDDRFVDIWTDNPPEQPYVMNYKISCSFNDDEVEGSADGSVMWELLDPLPTGTNIPDPLELKRGENVLNWSVVPDDGVKGAENRDAEIYIRDDNCKYDFYNEGNTLVITIDEDQQPIDTYATIVLSYNNFQIVTDIAVKITAQ